MRPQREVGHGQGGVGLVLRIQLCELGQIEHAMSLGPTRIGCNDLAFEVAASSGTVRVATAKVRAYSTLARAWFMKILLSAYSCGANMNSEPAVAWRAVNHALEQGHEVWTITERSGYEKPMLEYLAEHPMPGYHPVFLQLRSPLSLMRRPGMIGSVYYHLWQEKLLEVARDLHRKVGFDLAHHVTFARYWSPSGVRGLGIPFIWGPVGAAESAPPAFLAEMALRDRCFEFIRDGIRHVSHRGEGLRATARAATIAIGISREACDALRSLGARRVEQLPLTLDDEVLARFDRFPPPPPGPFRAICMGRLLHWKGFYLAIRAFAKFARNQPDAELWIVGGGPFRAKLEQTAAETGVSSRVRFFGHLSHDGGAGEAGAGACAGSSGTAR